MLLLLDLIDLRKVERLDVLGGLIHEYESAAA
jgi:hypothetical protein